MMSLADLWLPILVAGVFVFIVSSILHMVIPIHKSDYKKMSGEEKVLAEMRTQGVQPGGYSFPCAETMKNMGSPEMIEKFNLGPVGFLTVVPSGVPAMGKCLTLWFLYSLMMGVFVAYVATLSLTAGAESMAVFRLTGTAAILGYAPGVLCDSIWKGQNWSTTLKFVFDGIVYGLVTAGAFCWLWPAVA